MGKLKLGILGSGFHSEIIVKAWKDGLLEDYELVGVMGRNPETRRALADLAGCRACSSVEELLELKPDYIAEAASIQLIRESAQQILSAGCNLVMISIGAFADEEFYEKIRRTAADHHTRVYLASGCVGGFDVLRAVSLMGCSSAGIETHKGPNSLRNTPLFREELMNDGEETQVFGGSAAEAIELLPTKVNVAVAASLVTKGPKNTDVKIYSVPGYVGDDHRITAEAEGVKAVVDIYSNTSALAAWSEVAVLRNIVSPIVF